jgi:hypothetical protein
MVRTALATSPADSEFPHALGLTLIRLKRLDETLDESNGVCNSRRCIRPDRARSTCQA